MLRKECLRWAGEGAVYVPFCGDGDIAAELYRGRRIYAADIDPKRVEVCRKRLPEARIEVADCDRWPFAHEEVPPFAVADFDSYIYPYASFRAFWGAAPKASRMALFFTDAQRQAIKRSGILTRPTGDKENGVHLTERRVRYNFYWSRIIEPWFQGAVKGWRIVQVRKYLRRDMVYWGAVVEP
jgi:hypothetical protein